MGGCEAAVGGTRGGAEAKGDPFVEGMEVTYADFVLVSIMVFLERASSGHKGAVERFVDVDGCFGRLWEGCTGWMERDD